MLTAKKLGIGTAAVGGLSGLGGLLYDIFGKRKSQDGSGRHRRRVLKGRPRSARR